MDTRYEIRERIAQGGMGSVFRAYDARMNREVAIKRIRPEGGDATHGESAAQILQEAGALASLQHPNIVTVYDVGSDEEGPYVVMEFINGKTVDELIDRAPLTWPDFRELAIQTQEALIAAQERNIVHRDIKPSNLMLTWLPSGKFQIKVVDFGLAKFSEPAALDQMDKADSVFGSIYFMCPEQFERAELDARADLYSMGCVYYHALTQSYPFSGNTTMAVMTAHLHHQVTPLQELRPDLPRWVCDWVMWHLNRQPADRPTTSRDALKVFFQNDNHQPQPNPQPATPAMSTGPTNPAPDQPRRPRLIIPGAPQPAAQPAPEPVPVAVVPEPPRTQTAPQPLLPPAGSLPSVHASPEPQPAPAPPPPAPEPAAAPPPPPVVAPPPPPAVVAPPPPVAGPPPPVAVAPPPPPAAAPPPAAVLKPAAAAVQVPSSRLAVGPKPAAPAPAAGGALPPAGGALPPAGGALGGYRPGAAAQQQAQPAAAPVVPQKPGLSNGAKVALVVVLGLMVVLAGFFVLGKSGTNKRVEIYNRLVKVAAEDSAKEVPVNKSELQVLLEAATDTAANKQRQTVYKALWLAKATDGTDVDATIAEVATKQAMSPDVREVLIRDVLRKRKNPSVVPMLMDFCRSTDDTRAAIAAIQACRFMATDKEFPKYVEIVEFNSNASIRQAAEENIGEILKKAPNREELGTKIISAQAGAVNDEVKYALTRLLGPAGGKAAADAVKKSLAAEDKKEQLAAAVALGTWADDSMFESLMEHLEKVEDEQLRSRTFDAAFRFLTLPDRKRDADTSEDFWKSLARSAKTQEEQMKIIRGLANNETDDWAMVVIEYFVDEAKNDGVVDLAEKALERMRARAEEKGGTKDEDEDKDDEKSKDDEKPKDDEKKSDDEK